MLVLEYLKENTNYDNGVNAEVLISYLKTKSIDVERKTIYNDVKQLDEMGYSIAKNKDGYYFDDEMFEASELRVLIDMVKASRFLSKKTSVEIIEKLTSLTNRFNREIINSGDYFNKKTEYADLLINVEKLLEAISHKKEIRFRYYDLDEKKKKKYRGKNYIYYPINMLVDDDKYYLICYGKKYNKFNTFRLDKMDAIEIMENTYEEIKFDVNEYMRQTFGMYSGEKMSVKLKFDKKLFSEIDSQFGEEMILTAKDGENFYCEANINVSLTFFRWVFGFNGQIKILGPEKVREQYLQMCYRAIEDNK
jgi:predicted DNA-binding transcriptional regulator YafY